MDQRQDMGSRELLFVKQDNYVTRRIGEQTVIVPIKDGAGDLDSVYTLNEVGTRIWQLIDGATPVQRIVDIVGTEYEVSVQEAAKDVAEFLDILRDAGIIRPSHGDMD